MILSHMDEKWFFIVRLTCKEKVILSIGLEPTDQQCQRSPPTSSRRKASFTSNRWSSPVVARGLPKIQRCPSSQEAMREEFAKRDWILFNQPAQSPVTNTKDACVFPMMSKAVSREQSLSFGSRLMQGEELNQTVSKIFNDQKILPAISRSYAGHHQIPCAIIEYNGDNNYLSERKGMHFGVRSRFVTTPEGDGVMVVPEPLAAGESAQEQIIAHRRMRGLKFSPPNVGELEHIKPTPEMIGFLREHMEFDRMTDEVKTAWERVADAEESGRPMGRMPANFWEGEDVPGLEVEI